MWFCRPHGTHCLNEIQVFIQGTRDHNTFRFYAEQTYDECIARVIIPKTVKRGKVFGDVFEINYREQAANVAQNSVAPDHDRLTFADGLDVYKRQVLGKETIDLYNTSETRSNNNSYGLNYQKTGKELMSQDEIAVMDGAKCILQLRGVRPFLSNKYDITKHPKYRQL